MTNNSGNVILQASSELRRLLRFGAIFFPMSIQRLQWHAHFTYKTIYLIHWIKRCHFVNFGGVWLQIKVLPVKISSGMQVGCQSGPIWGIVFMLYSVKQTSFSRHLWNVPNKFTDPVGCSPDARKGSAVRSWLAWVLCQASPKPKAFLFVKNWQRHQIK